MSFSYSSLEFKDRRDVTQFCIIFFDILFLTYLHLNLLILKNSGYITRLVSELEYFEFFFKIAYKMHLNAYK